MPSVYQIEYVTVEAHGDRVYFSMKRGLSEAGSNTDSKSRTMKVANSAFASMFFMLGLLFMRLLPKGNFVI